jgi:signal transduction histidine kinase
VAPLVAGRNLVGLVACGDRFREPLQQGDLELLGLLARDAELGLVNRRLEAELGLRLADLRRSRQRLVSAQDEERRRVERDLHDGVQAQLVALAVQVRQLAAAPEDATGGRLAGLADEVEEALFGLQDLARGIYPSVLTDRGLPAALRTQAARMPMDVHLEVDGGLVDRRLPADVEAALYFVALEALSNAQKHAADARVVAGLRLVGDRLALEVSDDGPGFESSVRPGRGSGLVNMADRMEAIGGTLTVSSARDSGTRISALAPLPAAG